MSPTTSTAGRQRAVWRISAALADSRLDQHEQAVADAFERAGLALGVEAIGLWETDLGRRTTRQDHVWMAPGAPDSARDDVERPVADGIVAEMLANDGLAVFPLTVLANDRPVAAGWENGSGVLALIDLVGDTARTVSVITPDPDFDDGQLQFIQAFATIMRQYFTRIRIERDLEERLELAAFTSDAVARLGTANEGRIGDVVRSVLAELAERVGVRTALVFRVSGERLTRVHLAGEPVHDAWRVIDRVADRRFMSSSGVPRTTPLFELASAIFGADQQIVESDDTTCATLVPTEVNEGQVRKTLCIVHDPREWTDAELDAFSAISAAIAQNRARAEAEQISAYREAVQSEFAAIGAAFLRATPETLEDIVADATGRICRRLGASIGVVFRVDGNGEGHSRIVTVWSAGEAPYGPGDLVAPAQPDMPEILASGRPFERVIPLTRGLVPEFRELVEAEGEAVWTVLAEPLSGGPNPAAFAIGLPGDHGDRIGTIREVTAAFADLLSQLRARVRLELAAGREAAGQALLRRASATLTERSVDDFDAAVGDVLASAADFLQLAELSSWQIDEDAQRYVVRHSVRGGHAPGTTIPFGAQPAADAARRSRGGADGSPWRDPDGSGSIAIGRGDGVHRAVLVGRMPNGDVDPAAQRLLEELSGVLGRFEERIAGERYNQSAFGAAPIGIVLCDDDGAIVQCNSAFADFVAHDSPFDLVGRLLREIVPVDVSDAVDAPSEFSFQRWDNIRIWGMLRATRIESAASGERLWLIHVEDISDRRRAHQLLRHQATHDELTGLANRRVLAERTEEALAVDGRPAVLLLDLDRFKNINDSLGHDRGDELLIAVADRLRLAVRPDDLVVRLGGDEFAVLVAGPVDEVDARRLADRLRQTLATPLRVAGQDVFPSASIGIAVADAPTSVADMLRRADTAMYRAKSEGRGRHATFDDQMREQVTERLSIEAGLRRALDQGELCVHYQPEVCIADGQIIGAEALIRWQHPDRGLLPAAAFITVAEETGFVTEIGEMVLETACHEAVDWPDPSSVLRVNFAAAQLQRHRTVAVVRDALTRSGLPAERLCVEITESAMMEDVRQAEDVLHRLKGLGVQIAVDDFGTGFSSLAYLKRFPVDALKIDRTFVDGLDGADSDDTFVRSIISLADALGLDVVAEGVENEAHIEALSRLGCRRAQGYYFGRPMPATELRSLFAATI